MNDEPQKAVPDPSKSEQSKTSAQRQAQVEQAKARLAKERQDGHVNPIAADVTYSSLRGEERVVMRHQIALNIDSFRAAPDGFVARPQRAYPPIRPAIAPFMSVIVPNYNGQHLLPSVLQALQRQTFLDFEVVVIDDASSDGSVAWMEATHPDIRLLINRKNQGFVASCNAAADAAYGRILVLLNSDTEPEPNWLAELARAICAHPQAGIFASKMLLFEQRDRLHTTGDLMGADGIPRNRGVWEKDDGQYDTATQVFGACGGAAAYRREVWRSLGGFDEDYWMYLEDVDLAFRAQLVGWQAIFVPTARVYHRLSASGGDILSSFFVGRNTIWTIAKNMPSGLLARNLGRIVGAQIRITFAALRHIRGAAARARLAGQWAGLVGLPRQLHKRRAIQARRLVEDADSAARLGDSHFRK